MNNEKMLLQALFPELYSLSYSALFIHFGFTHKMGKIFNTYFKIGHTYYVFRKGENSFSAINTKTLQELSLLELLIELAQTNELTHLQQLCRTIKSINSTDLNLTNSISFKSAISLLLMLKQIPDNEILGFPTKTFSHPQLKNRLFIRNDLLTFPLSLENNIVNLVSYQDLNTPIFLNSNFSGSWSSEYEEGSSKLVLAPDGLDLLRFFSTRSYSDHLAYLAPSNFSNARIVEVLQWAQKNQFSEIIIPYTEPPWIFGLRIFCQMINIEIPTVTINIDHAATNQLINLSLKSNELDFAFKYSGLIAQLNKQSRKKIKELLDNENIYDGAPEIDRYFLFNSENRSLNSKNFKSLSCFNSSTNAHLLLENLIKTWAEKFKLTFISVL